VDSRQVRGRLLRLRDYMSVRHGRPLSMGSDRRRDGLFRDIWKSFLGVMCEHPYGHYKDEDDGEEDDASEEGRASTEVGFCAPGARRRVVEERRGIGGHGSQTRAGLQGAWWKLNMGRVAGDMSATIKYKIKAEGSALDDGQSTDRCGMSVIEAFAWLLRGSWYRQGNNGTHAGSPSPREMLLLFLSRQVCHHIETKAFL
jgi:hypothetical protein